MLENRIAWIAAAILVAAACSDGSSPALTPPEPKASKIELTSALDTVLSVGRSSQLTATVRDQAGNLLSGASVEWSSSDANVAAVSASGMLAAAAAGISTVNAKVADGNVNGSLRIRVVDADLADMQAIAGDALIAPLVAGLSPARSSALQQLLNGCTSGAQSGNLMAVKACADGVHAQAEAAAEANDKVLLAVAVLYADAMLRFAAM